MDDDQRRRDELRRLADRGDPYKHVKELELKIEAVEREAIASDLALSRRIDKLMEKSDED